MNPAAHSQMHDVAPASVEMPAASTLALGDKAAGAGCLFRLATHLAGTMAEQRSSEP